MTEEVKRTRKSLATLSQADIDREIAALKAKLSRLEEARHGSALDDAIKNSKVLTEIHAVKAITGDVDDIAVLKAIGKALKIKRLVVEQATAVPRKKKATASVKEVAPKK